MKETFLEKNICDQVFGENGGDELSIKHFRDLEFFGSIYSNTRSSTKYSYYVQLWTIRLYNSCSGK